MHYADDASRALTAALTVPVAGLVLAACQLLTGTGDLEIVQPSSASSESTGQGAQGGLGGGGTGGSSGVMASDGLGGTGGTGGVGGTGGGGPVADCTNAPDTTPCNDPMNVPGKCWAGACCTGFAGLARAAAAG